MRSLLRRLYSPVESHICVPAGRDKVFDVLADPDTYPSWLVGAHHMRHVDADFPREGSTFDHSVGAGPLTVDDRSESVGLREDERLALVVHVGPFHARVDFELDEQPDGQTQVTFRERPVGAFAPLTPVLRHSLQVRNATSLHRLRDVVVGRTTG